MTLFKVLKIADRLQFELSLLQTSSGYGIFKNDIVTFIQSLSAGGSLDEKKEGR